MSARVNGGGRERYWEEYELGSQRTTPGRTITETDIVVHAGHTGDFHPYHMDADWASRQPVGQRIAHGTLTFSVAVGLTGDVTNPLAVSYGYDRIRFVRPVLIGDSIHVVVTVTEKREDPKRAGQGVIIEAGDVRNQRNETVLAFSHICLVARRQPGGTAPG